MNKMTRFIKLFAVLNILVFAACRQKPAYTNPAGYDLTKPQKYIMPDSLSEISGIAFNKGNADTLYAEEDEHGRVYYLKPGAQTAGHTEFKVEGDFEDMAIINNQVVVLQSKGVFFTFPLSSVLNPKIDNPSKIKDLLPEGEYEGMYGDEKESKLYVLCKHCSDDKAKESSGYIFDMAADGALKQSGEFKLNVKHIEEMMGEQKIKFHPSALSRSPLTGEWFILSSVNKVLVIADEKWKIREVHRLNPDVFIQPEGMTFDKQNNLYISNEGQPLHKANVLKFAFTKPKD
ncbi:hypothetical protein BH09BAC6_BH09BAC6_29040 [soil metagenome]|jgi:uncharacterized protein YjiK